MASLSEYLSSRAKKWSAELWDGLINALGYGPYVPGAVQQLGPVYYVATDFATGTRVRTLKVGDAPIDEPLELTGTIGRDGALWQATVGRMLKISR